MSTTHIVTRDRSSRTPRRAPTCNTASDYLANSLQERFAIFDAFAQEMKDNPIPTTKIAQAHAGAGRRSVKRVPVPLPPTVFESPEEEDCLEEAESTTACDDGSPVYASLRDKPLPLIPRREKKLPPTPIDKNKPLPPLPPRHNQQSRVRKLSCTKNEQSSACDSESRLAKLCNSHSHTR
ncbi:hypothetical protein OH77DRAFT_466995 [Trametes cingulata]|nr:hypothetical protein OH77DRAFT_466995 [Trametes cingulata]